MTLYELIVNERMDLEGKGGKQKSVAVIDFQTPRDWLIDYRGRKAN